MPMYPARARGLMVGYFRIVGTGAQASEPIEKVVATATEAEFHRVTLQRLCGRGGVVKVSGKNGRAIRPGQLQRLMRKKNAEKINLPV